MIEDEVVKHLACKIAQQPTWRDLVKYAEIYIGQNHKDEKGDTIKQFIKDIAEWADQPFSEDAYNYKFGEQLKTLKDK